MENDECLTEFRYFKQDILACQNVLLLHKGFVCYNCTNLTSLERLYMFLRRYAYPCRYSDMIFRFGRPVPELCVIANHVMYFVYEKGGAFDMIV